MAHALQMLVIHAAVLLVGCALATLLSALLGRAAAQGSHPLAARRGAPAMLRFRVASYLGRVSV
jgi:hypothetical protein